jgi:amino acid transporter
MSTQTRNLKVAPGDDPRLKRAFGMVGLLFTATGSIIGSGWLFAELNSAEKAGPASTIAWLIGTVMFGLIGLSYSELGTMFPHSGGVARFPQYSHGSFASFIIGWITWVAAAAVAPIEVLAVVQYAKTYLPWIQKEQAGVPVLTGAGLAVSIGLMAVFTLVNFFGVRWFARINNVLVWWKLFMVFLVIVVFIAVAFHPGHFTASRGGFMPYGVTGIFSAVSTAGIAFAFLGFRQGVELAGEAHNPRKAVPVAVIGSIVLCGAIYILLQMAFLGATPSQAISAEGWQNVGNHFGAGSTAAQFGPLYAIAGVIGIAWLGTLILVDAFISPADTGLIYTGVTARVSYGMGRNRNAPSGLAMVSNRGVPWISLLLSFVIGCLFFLPFPGWQELVGFVTSATVLSFGAGPLVLVALRRRIPNQSRPFRLPASWLLAGLALLSSNLIVYWTGWEKDRLLFIAVAIGFVLFLINQLVDRLRGGGTTPQVDFKHGWWVLLWLVGLCLGSFLGSFGSAEDPSKSVGNLEWFGNLGGFIWMIVLAAIVMFLAWWFALPKARIEETVTALTGTAEEESQPESSAADQA